MVKRKSCGGAGPFSAGSVVWVPYKGIQWPAVVSRLYASQKKVTYKFLPLDESGGVFNAPISKIRPFLLKDQLPEERDEKLKAAFEAALEEVTKQRLEKGVSLEDPEGEINEEEHSSDVTKKRFCKVDEKLETRKTGQKDFGIGDIVLVNWFGYAEWPAVVLFVRKHTVACHFFPLKTGRPGWCRKSACQEFSIDQKTFTAMRKREATRERQLALDEAWELMTNTTKEERKKRYIQSCEALKTRFSQSVIFPLVFDASDEYEESRFVTTFANVGELFGGLEQEGDGTRNNVDQNNSVENDIERKSDEKYINDIIVMDDAESPNKKRKASEEKSGIIRTHKEEAGEDCVLINHFDYAMEEFLKGYSFKEGYRKRFDPLDHTRDKKIGLVGTEDIKESLTISFPTISNDERSCSEVIRTVLLELITQVSHEFPSSSAGKSH